MPLLFPQLPKGPHYGILAEFATPADLYHACERVRDAGFTRWDAHSPFPVHGLARAMGIGRSPLPWIVLGMGLTGAALGAVLGMLGLNRLPMHYHPLFRSRVFERVTDDAFFISIESWDPRFDPSATGKLLESLGARSVELLES